MHYSSISFVGKYLAKISNHENDKNSQRRWIIVLNCVAFLVRFHLTLYGLWPPDKNKAVMRNFLMGVTLFPYRRVEAAQRKLLKISSKNKFPKVGMTLCWKVQNR